MVNGRLYLRTEAGKAAWQRQDPKVPVEYRHLLGLIERDTNPGALRLRLGRFSEADAIGLLDELVERGLLRAVDATAQQDFTSSPNFRDLLPNAA